MVTGYRLDGQGLTPSRGKRFSVLHNVQTVSGAHPTTYPIGTGALSPV
jgi:hypothetical protein